MTGVRVFSSLFPKPRITYLLLKLPVGEWRLLQVFAFSASAFYLIDQGLDYHLDLIENIAKKPFDLL